MTDDNWQVPELTQEQEETFKARQRERDLLSNAMSQYLLKGYRMLGKNCSECQVISYGYKHTLFHHSTRISC